MSANAESRYRFKPMTQCNMCGSPAHKHKILGRRLDRSQGRRPGRLTGISVGIRRCNDCGLIYSDPQPIPLDLQDHYGVPPADYWKPEYFQLDEAYFAHEIAILGRLTNGTTGLRTLDIGAGLGKQMIALERAGHEAHGFEPSHSFHSMAIERMAIRPERLRLGMLEEIDYPADHFDMVSFGAVLEHLYDPAASIEKALRWTRPGGFIHIEVPSADWLIGRLINLYYELIGSDLRGNLSPMHPPYHLYEFTLNSFISHARLSGYEVAHHEYFVCQTFLPRILSSVLVPIMRRTNTGMQLSIWLKKTT